MSKFKEEISSASFEKIWNEVIEKTILKYKTKCLFVDVSDDAYGRIWDNYVAFKNNCRNKYMKDPDELLDRHKVCACMIFAIIKANVIYECVPKEKQTEFYSVINEDLALTTGLSLLRAFVESSIRESSIDEKTKIILLKKYEHGFKYPGANHGEYRSNFLSELHYTKMEENYNILSLAHTLFLLETYTRCYDAELS